jgi:hypothetical protein
MKLFIRNMVCIRCKMVVKDELTKLGLRYSSVQLGEAELPDDITLEQHERIRAVLSKAGLELMDL